MWDLRSSQCSVLKLQYSGIWCHLVWYVHTIVLEEPASSILTFEAVGFTAMLVPIYHTTQQHILQTIIMSYLDVPSMYSIYIPYIPNTNHSEEFVHCEAFLKAPLWQNILKWSVTHPAFNLQTRDTCPQSYSIYFTAVLFALLSLSNWHNIVHGQINLTNCFTDYKVW